MRIGYAVRSMKPAQNILACSSQLKKQLKASAPLTSQQESCCAVADRVRERGEHAVRAGEQEVGDVGTGGRMPRATDSHPGARTANWAQLRAPLQLRVSRRINRQVGKLRDM
jgi:hypothetical protein